jgi:hypothetical protein
MHEAGLAGMVASQLREARLAGRIGRPRLVVRGGHHDPADFDASLRLHLALVAPELARAPLEIVHLPMIRLCSGCGRTFSAAHPLAACPACGSAPLPSTMPEDIELDWTGEQAG